MVLKEGPNMVKVAPDVKVFVQVDGVGKPIVLVHGFALNHDMWRNQVLYLTNRGYRVIRVDLRGFGNSDKPEDNENYTYNVWANDLGKVIKKAGAPKVTLVGFSLGGAIASYYTTTRRKPGVEQLVLAAAAGPYMSFTLENAWDHWHCGHICTFFDALIDLVNDEKYYESVIQFYGGVLLPLEPEIFQWFQDMFKLSSKEALLGALHELRNQDLRDQWRKIRAPTRIVGGWTDSLVPFKLVEEQTDLIAGSKPPIMLIGGHGIFFEEADEFNRALIGE
ncbi:MAG: alpha/beta fold hydrolase [Halobacteriota archaeon]